MVRSCWSWPTTPRQTFEAEVQAVVTEDLDALALIGFEESSRILTSLIEQGFTPQNKKIYMVDGNTSNIYYLDLPAGALNGEGHCP